MEQSKFLRTQRESPSHIDALLTRLVRLLARQAALETLSGAAVCEGNQAKDDRQREPAK